MNAIPTARLEDLCRFQSGGTPSKGVTSFFEGSIPWITGADITALRVTRARSFITEEAVKKSATTMVPPGTVLLVTRTSVGKVAVAGVDLCFSQDITALTPDASRLDANFLVRYLQTQQDLFAQRSRGATIKGITRDMLASLQVPLPSLSEQRRISMVLDAADGLRETRRAAIAEIDALFGAIFRDMFGDPETNPLGWKLSTLGDLLADGPQNGLYKPASDYGSGTPILRIDGFYDGVVTGIPTLKRVRISDAERTAFALQPDDIVINRVNSREYLGKTALIPDLEEATVYESNMMRFRVDRSRLEPAYLVTFLQTEYAKAQILKCAKDAVNQSSVNQSDVRGLVVGVPPLAIQKRFTGARRTLMNLRDRHRQSQAMLDTLFSAIQRQAFRGEV